MINPHFNHSDNVHFINSVQFINFAPAAASTYDRYHDIVAFTIPVLLTFVQIRFPSEDLFQTHPITIIVVLCSLLAYSLAFAFSVLVRYFHRYDYSRKWCCMAMVLFGSVSVASLVWLLVSTLVYLLLVGQVLLVLGVVLKLLLLLGGTPCNIPASIPDLRSSSPDLHCSPSAAANINSSLNSATSSPARSSGLLHLSGFQHNQLRLPSASYGLSPSL
ncbi:hypothetical protein M0R45_034746 [Rubus argutus]|uniref:Uncharacterized protein n=1 Tax=Rubus argutus TaxID=59490 RepID=A0AAW1VRV8_RUBAR